MKQASKNKTKTPEKTLSDNLKNQPIMEANIRVMLARERIASIIICAGSSEFNTLKNKKTTKRSKPVPSASIK